MPDIAPDQPGNSNREAEGTSSVCAGLAGMAEQPLIFNQVLEEEIAHLKKIRRLARESTRENAFARAHESQLVGLALSGGGIRSATFNLGVLQALAKSRLLQYFHYLSTVSGGGYIGSWYTSWICRENPERVRERLEREFDENKKDEKGEEDKEWNPVIWLRRFSNYLTPKTGAFSLDSWTAFATYCRNLLLNLLILTLALTALLFVPRLIVEGILWFPETWRTGTSLHFLVVGTLFVFASVFATAFFWRILVTRSDMESQPADNANEETPGDGGSVERQKAVIMPLLFVAIPIFLAAVFVSLWLGAHGAIDWNRQTWQIVVVLAAAYALFWFVAILVMRVIASGQSSSEPIPDGPWLIPVTAFFAGFGGITGLLWTAGWLSSREIDLIIWGPPLTCVFFMLTAILHIGLMGRDFDERYRQWWSRLGAWVLILSMSWLALFLAVFYGPPLLACFPGEVSGILTAGWLAATAAGLWVGRRRLMAGRIVPGVLKAITAFAPYVFLIGMIAAISLATESIVTHIGEGQVRPLGFAVGWFGDTKIVALDLHDFYVFVAATVMALLLSWRVDVNEFSMHNFYRHRLVRAYLGASRIKERQPALFTGFDPNDDISLYDFASDSSNYEGPLQILNTSINITSGQELAYQERKASSFFFTPLHLGFDPGPINQKAKEFGFWRIRKGNAPTLGTALAISGAALNPNMGYYSAGSLAFLMTIFNMRLGWWLENPSSRTWHNRRPCLGLLQLFKELFGATSASAKYVNLADGGFFDNLGIYELVRRRCRFILACDVEADPNYEFNGLGNAIRRCRSDFGINIEIQLDPIRPKTVGDFSKWHCAVGRIRYGDVDELAPDGTLVYLKASMTGDEPEDLLHYRKKHPNFPHEATSDQWFGESQFESYRTLGYHEASEVIRAAEGDMNNIESIFVALRRAWYPPSSLTTRVFTRHTEKLVELLERVRADDDLGFLDKELFFDISDWPARGGPQSREPGKVRSDEELRGGFYLCSSMIQLMENVYLDLDLEHEWQQPDNRGWMNLFHNWVSSSMFRETWAVCAATYGARFRTFCKRRLKLDPGYIWVDRRPIGAEGLTQVSKQPELTAREVEILDQIAERSSNITSICYLNMYVLKGSAALESRKKNKFDKRPKPLQNISLKFPFGIALLQDVKNHSKTVRHIRFLRVRDHLRNLGLARHAIERLIVDHGVVDIYLIDRELYDAQRKQELEDTFRSAWNEYSYFRSESDDRPM